MKREAYPGPWLPEPVSTGPGGPLETAELRDTLSYATLHMMERLSPPERAVFVLREAFDLPLQEIAPIVQVSPASSVSCITAPGRGWRAAATGSGRSRPSTPHWSHVSWTPRRAVTWAACARCSPGT